MSENKRPTIAGTYRATRDQQRAASNGRARRQQDPAQADPPEPTEAELAAGRARDREAAARQRQRGDADDSPETPPPPPRSGWTWQPIPSCTFAERDYRPHWLVSGLLVADQPAVLGGPQKALKTSIGLDLAISVASGTPFLGRWTIPQCQAVAVLSGESGAWTIQETARRICAARGLDLAALPIGWQFALPRLADPADLDELSDGLRRDGIALVLIDPLYLALLAGGMDLQASNLYQMGPLLLGVARACLDAGATPVLLHHTTRPASRSREPLDLADLAFAGIAEFARQWLLVSRREAFAPGEPHHLWLAAGGSCGHGGLWAVDIDEGTLGEDFAGRRWEVEVRPATQERQEGRNAASREREAKRVEKEQADERSLLAALDEIDPEGKGASLRQLRTAAGMGDNRADQAVYRLRRQGIIEEVPGFTVEGGRGARQPAKGVRRVRDD